MQIDSMLADEPMLNPIRWLAGHSIPFICVGGICFWVSGYLILRIWMVHRAAPTVKKWMWSLVLLVPLFGWLAYGGLFVVPNVHDMPWMPEVPGVV